MDVQSLKSFGKVKITVHKRGFGWPCGVYYVKEDISLEAAVRLVNNNNATLDLETTYEDPQYKHQEQISDVHQERSTSSDSNKTGRGVRNRRKGAKKNRISESTLHKSDSGSGAKRGRRSRKRRAKASEESINTESLNSEIKDPWE